MNKIIENFFLKKIILVVVFLFIFTPIKINATSQNDLDRVRNQLNQTQKELLEKNQQSRTLTNEVANFNSHIASVQNELTRLNNNILKNQTVISETETQIVKTKEEIEELRTTLREYIRILYKEGMTSPLEIVIGSNSFSEAINRAVYLENIQSKIDESLNKATTLKESLETKREELEAKKNELQQLEIIQQSKKDELSSQRNAKAYILQITRNQEQEYQKLIERLRAQQAAIEAEIWRQQNQFVSLGSVRKGDIIGYMGNSGFSSGPHLHFELRTAERQHINPNHFLNNGYFGHPAPGTFISQNYGFTTFFAYTFHTGIDYAARIGTPIRAVADGQIVIRVSGQPNVFPHGPLSYGNYVKIRHTNGMYSLYAHLR